MNGLLQIGLANAAASAALAVAVFAVGRVVRRPALLHTLWLLVLLKLITPPLLPLAVAWPATHLQGRAAMLIPADRTATAVAAAGWLWAAGAALCFGWTLTCLGRFHRLLGCARPAAADLQEESDLLAERLGLRHPPRVWLVPGPVPPLVWSGFGPTRLYFPAALVARLDADGRAALLAHELAHVVRRDHWVRWLELLVGGLFWWCPLVWWVRRQLRACEEECCDAWVVGELPPPAYARAILTAVDFLAERPAPLAALASGLGGFHLLKRRLTVILCGTPAKRLSLAERLAVGALVALLPLHVVLGHGDDRLAAPPLPVEAHTSVAAPPTTFSAAAPFFVVADDARVVSILASARTDGSVRVWAVVPAPGPRTRSGGR